jgi:para-aminobenzoate synthetase/4-amino-4-deoxychorismate lyase
VQPLRGFPLMWFGLFERAEAAEGPPPAALHHSISEWVPSIDGTSYNGAIDRIKTLIAEGETYQVNFTMRLKASFEGEPLSLFHRLVRAQRADYGAFVDTGRLSICSASPELFFQLDGRQLSSRPMKGTAARGRWLDEDTAQAQWLHASEKNRAENVMIVDMVRNDMGRVADVGSVNVPRLFHVEKYPTVWQMTSTVTSETDASLPQIMAALFPCASITGAPKARTMHIIADLETTPRKVYTGCIGFMSPQRRAQFNVAIRTVIVDKETGAAEYGVGGGIVWDSQAGDEYEECRIKAKVLTEKRPEFELLETILWEPEGGFFLLDRHLCRMDASARYFDFPFDREAVLRTLHCLESELSGSPQKIRLLLDSLGVPTCEASPLAPDLPAGAARLGVATFPVDSSDIFLYHKTTHRHVYLEARRSRPDCDDVLLWNEQGLVTESSIANVVILHEGEWITPPVECGLLPGTFRALLLDQGKIREKPVTMRMLDHAEKVFLVNSVRKWREAHPVDRALPSASIRSLAGG